VYLDLEKLFYKNFDTCIETTTNRIQNVIERYEEERQYVLKKL